jgi:hypothetical protein
MAESGREGVSTGGKGRVTSRSSSESASSSRVKVSPVTSSAAIEEKMEEDEQDRIHRLEEAVRELLDLCARYVVPSSLTVSAEVSSSYLLAW